MLHHLVDPRGDQRELIETHTSTAVGFEKPSAICYRECNFVSHRRLTSRLGVDGVYCTGDVTGYCHAVVKITRLPV